MKYVIYIDVFFCVNLVMDFIIIKLASLYIKPQTTYIRCLLGALTGSLFTSISILFPYKNMILHMLFSYIFIAIIMVIAAFGVMKIGCLIRNCLVMYAMTIFLGGLINFLYSYTYLGYMLQNVFRGMFQGINILWLSGVTTVSYLCIEGIIKYLKKINKYNMQVKVRLVINGRTKDIIALVDTGNSLREPYTGKPVHIVCMDSVLEMINDMDLYSGNLKYVPFQSIGKKNGLLKTIEFDEMLVYSIDKMSGEIKELIYKEESVIIGLFEGVLSGKSEFEMILHRSINLEGGLV